MMSMLPSRVPRRNAAFRPRPEPVSAELHLVALPTAAPWARSFTAGQLRRWDLVELIETATLVTSELVTNAVAATGNRHTPTPCTPVHDMGPAPIALRLRLTQHSLFVEVWDREPGPPQPTQASDLDESGRGLALVTAVSEAWDHYPSDAGGKVTWAEIGVPEDLARYRNERLSPPSGSTRTAVIRPTDLGD